jgi:hypothetical protein
MYVYLYTYFEKSCYFDQLQPLTSHILEQIIVIVFNPFSKQRWNTYRGIFQILCTPTQNTLTLIL